MRFKDQLALDTAVFLNAGEFAGLHDIDGEQITCVFDNDVLQKGQAVDGVYSSMKKLFIKSADLHDRPVVGQHIRVDGELYLVSDSTEAMGILEITLEANES